jgi:hypothetical protein
MHEPIVRGLLVLLLLVPRETFADPLAPIGDPKLLERVTLTRANLRALPSSG